MTPPDRPPSAPTTDAQRVVGLEQHPVDTSPLGDQDVQAAREGPTIDSLRSFVGGAGCDLQNIEVFYRLGLAQLARGEWDEALPAFESVEEASPGYRDAQTRIDALRAWQRAMGSHLDGVGRSLGDRPRYKIRGELERSLLAAVYRARDTLLGREVALAFLGEEPSAAPETSARFRASAQAAAQLEHSNIGAVHDYGVLEGRAFASMELVPGTPVEVLLAAKGGIVDAEAIRIAARALDALTYAHGREVLHRAITPARIVRTDAGKVAVTAFGLGSWIDGTEDGSCRGTPTSYLAPEQLSTDASEADHRADLFAMGVVLYEMLTGEKPFLGEDRFMRPLPPCHHQPSLPEALDEVIMRAIETDPEHRHESASELAASLAQAVQAPRPHLDPAPAPPVEPGPASHLEPAPPTVPGGGTVALGQSPQKSTSHEALAETLAAPPGAGKDKP